MTCCSKFRVFLGIISTAILVSCDPAPSNASSSVKLADESAELKVEEILLPETVSFNEHIQPILSENCYHCHGPDSGTREPKKSPLRLDRVEDAFLLRDDGKPAIIKGNSKESEIVKRMYETDPDSIMPPPRSHKTMKKADVAMIERWIDQGAEYQTHWAFMPIQRPAVPEVGAERSANPIDRFISERLQTSGMKSNPPDDPRRFHRRLTFDTTGLPPLPEETDAFAAAYEKDPEAAVASEADRLLATMASAEHFARHWLDAARYGDTHGIHIDNNRSIWPYRDWVISAFKANMPWDEFTTEQLAGDLLPNRTLDQQVASGFNRCAATTGEGGAIPEEYEAIYATDRVDTMSAAWLGLTTSCAACHDHKFDPVSTKEFYALTAFFRNNTMEILDLNAADHPPAVFVPIVEDRPRWAELETQIHASEQLVSVRKTANQAAFETWLPQAVIEAPHEIDSTLAIHLPLSETDGPIKGTVDGVAREWEAPSSRQAGPVGMAAVINDRPIDLGKIGSFSRNDQVSFSTFIYIENTPSGAVIAKMDPKQAMRGWELSLEGGKLTANFVDTWDNSATKLQSKTLLTPKVWHHVAVTFNGATASHQVSNMFIDGNLDCQGGYPNTVGNNIENDVPLKLGGRDGDEGNLDGGRVAIQDFRFYRRLLSNGEIRELSQRRLLQQFLEIASDKRTPEQTDALLSYFTENKDEVARELLTQLNELKTERKILRDRGSMSLVMEEKKDSEAFAHVLTRGVYSAKGDRVTANTPAVLPPMAADAPKSRLGLAQWLMNPDNPLPARVTMNRTWYYFFGNGLVETTKDFGIMGGRPSHPKLLDWLAAEFIDQRWNYREMLKQIVTSATYRQVGTVSATNLELDPNNRLLARGPRIRLDAEQIRDLALAASNLLSPTIGGPGVKPYQPEGVWESVAMPQSNTKSYQQDRGAGLYRRSIYTYWKRTAAPPTMEILNAPSREITCVQRERTNTPLQALALLNDPQFIEAARVLASHALAGPSDNDAKIDFITNRLLSRTLDPTEKSVVKKSVEAALINFRAAPEDAKKLIAEGSTLAPTSLDPAELAAWTLVASQIFNLDEAITR